MSKPPRIDRASYSVYPKLINKPTQKPTIMNSEYLKGYTDAIDLCTQQLNDLISGLNDTEIDFPTSEPFYGQIDLSERYLFTGTQEEREAFIKRLQHKLYKELPEISRKDSEYPYSGIVWNPHHSVYAIISQ